jgi:hypothetical protein
MRGDLIVFRNGMFASFLVGTLLVMCVSIVGMASAGGLSSSSLEEKTGKSVREFEKNPEEAATSIVTDYFTAIMKLSDSKGAPLNSFKIVKTDSSNPNDIRVSVILKYQDHQEWPALDYSIIKVDDTYQVQKQICVFDSIPESPTKGIAKCSKNFVTGSDGTISVSH